MLKFPPFKSSRVLSDTSITFGVHFQRQEKLLKQPAASSTAIHLDVTPGRTWSGLFLGHDQLVLTNRDGFIRRHLATRNFLRNDQITPVGVAFFNHLQSVQHL